MRRGPSSSLGEFDFVVDAVKAFLALEVKDLTEFAVVKANDKPGFGLVGDFPLFVLGDVEFSFPVRESVEVFLRFAADVRFDVAERASSKIFDCFQ